MEPLKALLFARVSTRAQSHHMQLQQLKATALRRGWIIKHIIVVPSGGAVAHRKALQKLYRQVNDVDVVACWRLDRLARTATELLAIVDHCRVVGTHLVSLTEAIDTSTPAGRMIHTLLPAMAEFEKNLIGERVAAGIAGAKERGMEFGRPPEARDIRETIGKLRNKGLSYAQIADHANVSIGTAYKYGRDFPILKPH